MEGQIEPPPADPNAATDKVAIVGAGPAGLSCGYYLGKQRIKSTIFEA